jgi:hypothetical protein
MMRTIADELAAMGDEVIFLANESLSPLLSSASFRCEAVNDAMGPLMGLYLKYLMKEDAPATVILGDYFSNANYLHSNGIDSQHILIQNGKIFTLDVWDFRQTGYDIDVFGGQSRKLGRGDQHEWSRQFEAIPFKLKPAPIVTPTSLRDSFCNLPPDECYTQAERCKARNALGLSSFVKVVLFCTSQWQHAPYESETATRLATSLPALVADYLSDLGRSVHLLHIGPQAYDLPLPLQDRYHWLCPVSPERFDDLLAGADLLLSANISATTIAKAMVRGVPVLVLQNSRSINNPELQATKAQPYSARLQRWLQKAAPVFPFALWPVGYYQFLRPLLQGNPYMTALDVVELLDEQQVQSSLAGLLFDKTTRAEQTHRQAAYVGQVRSLPTGAQMIKATFGG